MMSSSWSRGSAAAERRASREGKRRRPTRGGANHLRFVDGERTEVAAPCRVRSSSSSRPASQPTPHRARPGLAEKLGNLGRVVERPRVEVRLGKGRNRQHRQEPIRTTTMMSSISVKARLARLATTARIEWTCMTRTSALAARDVPRTKPLSKPRFALVGTPAPLHRSQRIATVLKNVRPRRSRTSALVDLPSSWQAGFTPTCYFPSHQRDSSPCPPCSPCWPARAATSPTTAHTELLLRRSPAPHPACVPEAAAWSAIRSAQRSSRARSMATASTHTVRCAPTASREARPGSRVHDRVRR